MCISKSVVNQVHITNYLNTYSITGHVNLCGFLFCLWIPDQGIRSVKPSTRSKSTRPVGDKGLIQNRIGAIRILVNNINQFSPEMALLVTKVSNNYHQ